MRDGEGEAGLCVLVFPRGVREGRLDLLPLVPLLRLLRPRNPDQDRLLPPRPEVRPGEADQRQTLPGSLQTGGVRLGQTGGGGGGGGGDGG